MLKIVANMSKKLPIPGLDYSSQSFMAGIEVEVSDGSTPEQLQHRIREVYHLLEHAVDSEIRNYGGVPEMEGTSMAGESILPDPRHDRGAGREHTDSSRNQSAPSQIERRSIARDTRTEQQSDDSRQNRSARTATQAQQKAIHAIAKANGLDRKILADRLREVYGVACVEELTVGDASELIDALKNASSFAPKHPQVKRDAVINHR